MKYLHITDTEIPLYRGRFIVVLSNSVKRVKKVLPNYESDSVYGHCMYDNYNGEQGYFIILNLNNEYRSINHGVIAHECLHAVNMLFQCRGVELSYTNDEPLTYLLEWMVDEVYKFIEQKGMSGLLVNSDVKENQTPKIDKTLSKIKDARNIIELSNAVYKKKEQHKKEQFREWVLEYVEVEQGDVTSFCLDVFPKNNELAAALNKRISEFRKH